MRHEFVPEKAIEYMNSYLLSNKCSTCSEESLEELNFYHEDLNLVRIYYLNLQEENFPTMEELEKRTNELQVMCNSCLKKKFNV